GRRRSTRTCGYVVSSGTSAVDCMHVRVTAGFLHHPRGGERAPAATPQRERLGDDRRGDGAVRHPDVPRVAAHLEKARHGEVPMPISDATQPEPRSRSTMIARTRVSEAAMQ